MNRFLNLIVKYRYLLYFLAVVPMFLTRDFTRNNELRYMSIAEEAIRNGSLFTFTNHGIHYADKPPLYLWIVMAGKMIFGTHSMFFLALFSYIPALVILWIMGRWTRNVVSRQGRIAGELMLLTSVFFIGSAVVLRMDMLMNMFIVLSLFTFFRMYSGEEKRRDKWMFPIYVFMAIFSKGPVGILVPLVTTITFLIVKRDFRAIAKYWGVRTLSVIIALCAVWFTSAYLEGGDEYINNLLFNQTINRAVDSFHHKEPFYYYMIAIWYSLAPWAFLIVGVLATGLVKRIASTDLEKFFLTSLLSTFIMLSFVSSKIQIYMLPAFAFFVFMTVLWLPKFSGKLFARLLIGIPAALFAVALPGALIATLFIEEPLLKNGWVIATAAVVSVTGALALGQLLSGRKKTDAAAAEKSLNRTIITMGAGLLAAIFTISFFIPQYNPNIGMGAVSREARAAAEEHGAMRYMYYNIPRAENIDVYLGVLPQDVSKEELKERIEAAATPDHEAAEERIILILMQSELKKDPEIDRLLADKEKHPVGYFYYVVL